MKPRVLLRTGLIGLFASGLVIVSGCGPAVQPTPTPTKATPAQATATPIPQGTPTPTPRQPKRGGTLRYIASSPPLQLDVLQTTTSADTTHMNPIYDGFFTVEPDRSFSPAQAASWEIGEGGKTITLRLVPGVQFHNSAPFTAQAVKNHFEYILNPDNKFEQRSAVATIEKVEAVNDTTVKLTLSKVDALVFPNLAARPGWVVSPSYRDATPAAERKNKPVGAGSFKLMEIRIDSHMTLERWDRGFSGGKYPYLDQLQFLYISDPAVQLATYRAGEGEVLPSSRPETLAVLKDDKNTVLAWRWQTEWNMFVVNPRVKPLDDVRVRKAMSMAVDRDAIIQATTGGEAAPLFGIIGPAWPWAWDPAYKKYGYDPAGAKKLLAEAGYANGFSVGPVTWFGKESLLPRMNLLADQMKQVGITLNLTMVESAQASREFRIDKKTAAYSTGWGTGAPDIDTVFRDWFYSRSPGFMYQGYLEPAVVTELDTALDNGRGSLDLKERAMWYKKAQDIISENMLGVSIYQARVAVALRNHVQDYVEFPSGGGSQWFKTWLDQ